MEFTPDTRVPWAASWRELDVFPTFATTVCWFVEPVLVFAVIVPKFIEDVVTFMATNEFIVTDALSEVPVVLSGVLKMTVVSQPCPEKLDDASVPWAKYCTANVVVVFCVPPAHVLLAVNAWRYSN